MEDAKIALESFGEKWDKKYKMIRQKWEEEWDSLTPFMDYSPAIRKMIYTTNPVEAVHRIMRKETKTKAAWCTDKGLIKQLYLTLMYQKKSWNKVAFNWKSMQKELIEKFGERYAKHLQ